jgi:uncharacterized protein YegL
MLEESHGRKLEDIHIENPPEPHCATVLVLDVSGSMATDDKIGQLSAGLQTFKEEVMKNDQARKRVDLAVVTFGTGVETLHPFSSVEAFEPPLLQAEGTTAMGGAILKAIELLEQRKGEYRAKGVDYYRPWIFLITDGEPTDMEPGDALWNQVIGKVHEGEAGRKFMFFAVAVEPANTTLLQQIAPPKRQPVKLKGKKFAEMFQWLSNSQAQVSASQVGEQVALENPTGPKGWAEIPTA